MPQTRRRSRRRRLLFVAVMLAFFALALEVGSFCVFWYFDGQTFGYARLDAMRDVVTSNRLAEDAEIERGQSADLSVVLHPYTGFVYSTDINGPGFESFHHHPVNRFGFIDSGDMVQKRSKDRVVIGVLGGSVAFWFTALGDDALRAALGASPHFAGKEIVLVRMALGGFKQPQQLMALSFALSVGSEFDIVLNIDGFNEVALPRAECQERGVFPFYPRGWDEMLSGTLDLDRQRMLGELVYLREERQQLARSYSTMLTEHSVTLQLLWRIRDRSLRHDIADKTLAYSQHGSARDGASRFAVRGPGPKDPDGNPRYEGAALYDAIAAHWARSSIQLNRLCRGERIRYLHFLQPNQYDPGAKPMGKAETAVAIEPHPQFAYRQGVLAGYPKLSARADELRDEGIGFHDLRRLFADQDQPIYIDTCCHFNRAGNKILAERIAAAILDEIAQENHQLVGLSAPKTLRIRSPYEQVRVDVRGTYTDGQFRSARMARTGTIYRFDDPSVFHVSATGRVSARSEGTTRLRVSNGRFTAIVNAVAEWDPVITFGEGIAGAEGRVPSLSTDGQTPSLGNNSFRIAVSNVVGGADGVFVMSRTSGEFELLGETVYVPSTAHRFRVRATGKPGRPGVGTAVLSRPIPNDRSLRGAQIYWQAFFDDENSKIGKSASRALMLTVR